MGQVIIHVGPQGLERIRLAATTEREERESLRLYRVLRPAIEALERAIPKPKGAAR